jgi:hypothetical protein
VKAQGWTPIVVDTNGERDAYVEASQPVDPSKDKRVMAAFTASSRARSNEHRVGPVDGRRLLAHRSARLHHPSHPGRESERDDARRLFLPPGEGYGSRASISPPTAWCVWWLGEAQNLSSNF